MNTANRCFASILLLASFYVASPALAEDEYYLKDGSKAVIVEKQLIVYPLNSKRYFAVPGKYQTRDGKYTIVVTAKGATVIRNEPQKVK
jgi:hypothetical protein